MGKCECNAGSTRIAIQDNTVNKKFWNKDTLTTELKISNMILQVEKQSILPIQQYIVDFFGAPTYDLTPNSATYIKYSAGVDATYDEVIRNQFLWNGYVVVKEDAYANMWGTSIFNSKRKFLSYLDIDFMPGFLRVGVCGWILEF